MLACSSFTYLEAPEAEKTVHRLLEQISTVVSEHIPSHLLKALLLIGGYGRGEGGVIASQTSVRPHNNLDLLLVLKDGRQIQLLQQHINKALKTLRNSTSIGIDLSCIGENKLKNSDCRVIWYDMRYGHKTLLGDTSLASSLTQCNVASIPHWDVRNLLVNRGSLLVINQLLLARVGERVIDKTIIKHGMKAIIGYGDALLFFLGDYHWSYSEKRLRMEKRQDVNPAFKALYESAMAFRFSPVYENYLQRDLTQWCVDLKTALEAIHLQCERLRLQSQDLDWNNYLDRSLHHCLRREQQTLKSTVRRVRDRLCVHYDSSQRRALGGWPQSQLTAKDYLPLLFPAVAYSGIRSSGINSWYRQRAVVLLACTSTHKQALATAYLRFWCKHMDANLQHVLEKLGLSIEEDAA